MRTLFDRRVGTDVKLLVVGTIAEALGLWASLVKNGLIAGADFSGHLVSAVYLFSGNISGMREPPLVPLITAFAVALGGVSVYQILAPVLFSIIAIPMFFILRELGVDKWLSLLATFAYVNTPALDSIVVYGTLDRLVGMFFLLLSVYCLIVVVKKPSRRSIVLSAIAMLAAVASHPFDLIILVLGGGVTLILMAALSRDRTVLASLVKAFLLAATFSLSMLPFYLPIIGLYSGGNPTIYAIRTLNLTYFISPFYSQAFPIQTIFLVVGAIAIAGAVLMLYRRRPTQSIILAFFLATISLPFLAVRYQAIAVQFSFAFVYLGFAYCVQLISRLAISIRISIVEDHTVGIPD